MTQKRTLIQIDQAARAHRKCCGWVKRSEKPENKLSCLRGAVSGGAEKEKGSRTSVMIAMLVFLGSSSLSRAACQRATWFYNDVQRSRCTFASHVQAGCFFFLSIPKECLSTAFASEPPGAGGKAEVFVLLLFQRPPHPANSDRALHDRNKAR
jgi:hypothetical protein